MIHAAINNNIFTDITSWIIRINKTSNGILNLGKDYRGYGSELTQVNCSDSHQAFIYKERTSIETAVKSRTLG